MYSDVAEHLRRVRADLVVVFTADHYNRFFETCVPIFAVGVADEAASDDPELPRRVVPIRSALASRIHAHAVRAGFRTACCGSCRSTSTG
jgi:hypothetical protein